MNLVPRTQQVGLRLEGSESRHRLPLLAPIQLEPNDQNSRACHQSHPRLKGLLRCLLRPQEDSFCEGKGLSLSPYLCPSPPPPALPRTVQPGNKEKRAGRGRVRRRGKASQIDDERN